MRPLLLLWATVAVLGCSAPDAPPTMTAEGPSRTGVILAGDAVATPRADKPATRTRLEDMSIKC